MLVLSSFANFLTEQIGQFLGFTSRTDQNHDDMTPRDVRKGGKA